MEDWLAAGRAVLCKHGIQAVKLAALTRESGVSTGSFYHHFTDFEDYLGRLAASYTADRVRHDITVALGDDRPGPIERIQRLARQSLKAGTFELDRAMRVWATMDPRAEAAIRRAETLVLKFLAQAFEELGFQRDDARLRAQMLLAINVAPVLPAGRQSGVDYFRACLDLLTRTPAAASRSPATAKAAVAAASRSPASTKAGAATVKPRRPARPASTKSQRAALARG